MSAVTDIPGATIHSVRRRLDTPVRLRVWMLSVMITAVALLATGSLLMSRTQSQVRVIGDEAAPQAATAADLYFALSDLDAQVARLVLIDGAPALAGNQIDALSTYQQRSSQLDADLERALTTGSNTAYRPIVQRLLDELAVYRQWAWQALTVESQLPPQPPGKLPPAALGYYTQATTVLHLRLLPLAQSLRDASQARLDDAYAAQRTTRLWGIVLMVVLGGGLLVLLVSLQVWLARRFRRRFNPALLAATLVTAGLALAACTVLVTESKDLGDARRDSLTPYLALSHAQAVSYDAAADASRYLISGNLAYYKRDFSDKAACLRTGGPCGEPLPAGPRYGDVAGRWAAYQRDHEKIISLADAGQATDAISALTGIRRGDAAFDFYYYDTAISRLAGAHKAAFDTSLRDAEGRLAGWPYVPIVAMGLVILLAPLALRKRMEEYR